MKTVNAYVFHGVKGFRRYIIADKGKLVVDDLGFDSPEVKQLYADGLRLHPVFDHHFRAGDFEDSGDLKHESLMSYINQVAHFFSGVGMDIIDMYDGPVSPARINRINANVCAALADALQVCDLELVANARTLHLDENSVVRKFDYVMMAGSSCGTVLTIGIEPLFKYRVRSLFKGRKQLPTVMFYVTGQGSKEQVPTVSLDHVVMEPDEHGVPQPVVTVKVLHEVAERSVKV